MNCDIKYIRGNIFTTKSQTIVNTVNCVGVMGAGIALEFKYRYPEMYEKYVKYCRENLIEIGKLWIYDVPNTNQKVLNFPTKKHWKFPSKYEYLEKGLKRFVETYQEKGIQSIAFPLLGAQNGGLDPEKVKDLMFRYLRSCDIPIEIYEYSSDASDDLFGIFVDGLIYSTKEFEKKTGLKKATVVKLKDILERSDLRSLSQLSKVKGVGEETIKACYEYSMQNKKHVVAIPREIFNRDVENLQIEHANETKEPVQNAWDVEKGYVSSINTGTGESMVVSPKDEKVKKRSTRIKKSKDFTVVEKIFFTGLDEETIKKIEAKDESISIKDLKTYCGALKISFRSFVTSQYDEGNLNQGRQLKKLQTKN